MSTPSSEPPIALEEQALLIASEIFNLINQYTHDSAVAKFFLPDEIATACYGLTAGFTSVVYKPTLTPDETVDAPLLSFYYALMTYGCNVYLKEHSLKTNASAYTLPTNKAYIKKVQERTLKRTTQGSLVSTPLADNVIAIILENIEHQMNMREFSRKGHTLNKKKFWDYTKLSLYWGYNFANELLNNPLPR